MKIGIFAGTFDPIHNGHIEFARSAVNAANLQKVIIVAEKEPYRKKPHASWDHRQAMIERATQEIENVDHDYGFAAELSHQHTMKNMLEVARKHYGNQNEYWFLVGSDIYEHIHQWHDLLKEHEYGGFVVALRDDHTKSWLQSRQQNLPIAPKTIVIQSGHPHVSSSGIRALAQQNQIPQDVPSPVVNYIQTHNIY